MVRLLIYSIPFMLLLNGCSAARKAKLNQKYRREAEAFMFKEDYTRAIACYSKAIRFNPTDTLAYNNRGTCKLQLDKTEEAWKDFQTILKLNPHYDGALIGTGRIKYDSTNYQGALKDFLHAMEYNPHNKYIFFCIANTYDVMHETDLAIEYYGKCIENKILDTTSLRSRGLCYLQQGLTNQACQDWHQANQMGMVSVRELMKKHCSK